MLRHLAVPEHLTQGTFESKLVSTTDSKSPFCAGHVRGIGCLEGEPQTTVLLNICFSWCVAQSVIALPFSLVFVSRYYVALATVLTS